MNNADKKVLSYLDRATRILTNNVYEYYKDVRTSRKMSNDNNLLRLEYVMEETIIAEIAKMIQREGENHET